MDLTKPVACTRRFGYGIGPRSQNSVSGWLPVCRQFGSYFACQLGLMRQVRPLMRRACFSSKPLALSRLAAVQSGVRCWGPTIWE